KKPGLPAPASIALLLLGFWLRGLLDTLLGLFDALFDALLGLSINLGCAALHVGPALLSRCPPFRQALFKSLFVQGQIGGGGFQLVFRWLDNEDFFVVDGLGFYGVEGQGTLFFADAENPADADQNKLDPAMLVEHEICDLAYRLAVLTVNRRADEIGA